MQIKAKPTLHASWIDNRALNIIERLQKKNHVTYLVGGCVRDLLLGIHPKDFDIATSARPEEVKRAVPFSFIIGKRFRLVLVKRGQDQFEVATFRRNIPKEGDEGEGESTDELPPIQGDNFFGTPEEDAFRRDFTVNGLFYDPISGELIDFVGGLQDLELNQLRMIGNPTERIIEDPIRALRAIRLSHKIGFQIEAALRNAIAQQKDLVGAAILPRKREEYLKILKLENPGMALLEMFDLGLLATCLPTLHRFLSQSDPETFLLRFDSAHRFFRQLNDSGMSVPLYLPLRLAFPEGDEKFWRDELGAFKNEMLDIEHIEQLSEKLATTESFQKRGARRQAAFLSQPHLRLAFELARFEFVLTPQQVVFWSQYLERPSKPTPDQ